MTDFLPKFIMDRIRLSGNLNKEISYWCDSVFSFLRNGQRMEWIGSKKWMEVTGVISKVHIKVFVQQCKVWKLIYSHFLKLDKLLLLNIIKRHNSRDRLVLLEILVWRKTWIFKEIFVSNICIYTVMLVVWAVLLVSQCTLFNRV